LSRPDAGAAEERALGGASAAARPGLINIANLLTVLRLCLVPIFVVLLVAGGDVRRIAACATFGIASLTDFLDGELARRRSLITDFGKIADPIADKALTGSALVVLSALGELPWWVTGVILFRELAVTGLRFWVISRGVIAASRGGKVKTTLQVIAIGLYILPGPFRVVRVVVMAAALIVTVATGADYVVRAVRLRRAVPGDRSAAGTGRAHD
jgi:CDP-diacylglycerol---glycerol-3-phosphate 3-phosphatidyltransferase